MSCVRSQLLREAVTVSVNIFTLDRGGRAHTVYYERELDWFITDWFITRGEGSFCFHVVQISRMSSKEANSFYQQVRARHFGIKNCRAAASSLVFYGNVIIQNDS